jgi:peptidoglycan/LPS O-acetylase OafA/YrhL
MNHGARRIGIEALRGYAASAVILLHATTAHPLTLSYFGYQLRPFFSLGVPLFFIISAFSLAYGYSERLGRPGAVQTYAIRRFFRIAPLFYFMLAAWSVYRVAVGGSLFSSGEYLSNITFTFGLSPEYYASVVPAGWSIGVEMLFYVLFPVLVKYFNSLHRGFVAICLVMLFSFVFNKVVSSYIYNDNFFIWMNFFTNLPYFCFGLIAYHCYMKLESAGNPRAWSRILLLSGVCAVAIMVFLGPMPNEHSNQPLSPLFVGGWGLAFGLIVISQALKPHPAITNRLTIFLGTISFSLYLVHPLVLYVSPVQRAIEFMSIGPDIKMLLAWLFGFVAIVPLAWLTYRAIEVPGQAFGKSMMVERAISARIAGGV